jgi:hypothetical protein
MMRPSGAQQKSWATPTSTSNPARKYECRLERIVEGVPPFRSVLSSVYSAKLLLANRSFRYAMRFPFGDHRSEPK